MKYSIDIIISCVFTYILVIFFLLIGFWGGMCIGLGEMGSIIIAMIILPIPFIIVLIISIYYFIKYKKNKYKFIYFLRFSVFVFIIAAFIGCKYTVMDINNIEKYLYNAADIVESYKINKNIEHLTEDDFKKINLPENITIEIIDGDYRLKYKFGIYYKGGIRTRRL